MLSFVSTIFFSRALSCSCTFCRTFLPDGESFLFKTFFADSDDLPQTSSVSTTTAESTWMYNGISHKCKSSSKTSYPRSGDQPHSWFYGCDTFHRIPWIGDFPLISMHSVTFVKVFELVPISFYVDFVICCMKRLLTQQAFVIKRLWKICCVLQP